jgi:PAS domain S-box-containing protein
MGWLACGVIYSVAYIAIGWLLRDQGETLLWFRASALLIPPLTGVVVIARRRHNWTGCHWLFWATIALGLMMSAIGLVGWTVDEYLLGRETSWLGWYTVFALFGAVAPLLGLLAQPHRGSREAVTATTAVDIAGIVVMTGFLYSRFVMGPDLTPMTVQRAPLPLLVLSEFQQLVVVVGMIVAAFVARDLRWGATYRRLAMGLFVNAVILSIANLAIWQGLYRSGFVYDVIWIMPYAFYPWAASLAPPSAEVGFEAEHALTPSRPWIVFSALCLIPLFDFALRRVIPLGAFENFRDLSTAITIFSVLPLLMARLAVEKGEAQQADRKRRLLAAATEQADELISIMRPDGSMEHANHAFCRMMGYTPVEVGQMSAAEFLGEQSRSQIEVIAETAGNEGIWRGTLVRGRRDGSTFLTSCTVSSLSDDDGRVMQLVAVERDVTRENELRDQLIHAERLAAAGQLVSGVAHELNNPLQSVVGYAELLLAGERRKEIREDLGQILSEASRATKIVHNLLTFVRRSSAAERAPAALNDIVKSAVALRSYEFTVANIAIEADYADNLPSVRVSREEIQQVLLNLLLNAEHALKTRGEGGVVRIRTMALDNNVVIDVHDDGPGVPANVAGQIFEPFFSTKEVGQGTGLGLAIALGIAEAHGGTLALADADQGARFRLTLPVAETKSVATLSEAPSVALSSIAGQRALVADDEEPVRLLLRRLLTRRGFAVDLAADGLIAGKLLEQSRYDVVLCDVKMPNCGGFAVYDTLKRRQNEALERFVFISGDILNADLHHLSDSGRVPLLRKPFDAAKLDRVLDEVMARRVGKRQVADAHPQ